MQSQRLQVFVVIMDSLPEHLKCPTKAVCVHFVPLPPLEGYTVQGKTKPFGEKDLSSITATPLLQSARDILL